MPASSFELVNPVPADAIPDWMRALATTFLQDPAGDHAERRVEISRRIWEPERAWGVRDRGRWVATLRTETRTISVPGLGGHTLDVRADALTNVTVAATHRRRGLMRQMLDGSLESARERGDALSILIAAEWPIYGRFGYAPATLSADYTLRRGDPGATCAGDPTRLRQVDREEFADAAPAVFDAARTLRPGQVNRSLTWWNRVLGRDGYTPFEGLPHNLFIHEGDDGPDGLLGWQSSGDFGLLRPRGTVAVWELISASDDAYRNMWSYLTGIDVVDTVTLSQRPVDEPVRWMLQDARTLVMTQHVDLVWLRLLDVPAALEARRYALPGDVVLEITDDDGAGFAAGRYRLRADGDEVECRRTTDEPDLRITQRALASIYLGGFRLSELRPAGVVTELSSGALARVDVMFSTSTAPWNATWF